MELRDAIAKAHQILDEERSSPTVSYTRRAEGSPSALVSVADLAETIAHIVKREERPMQVEENPRKWAFRSTNYNLMCALLSQVPQTSKASFLHMLLPRMVTAPTFAEAKGGRASSWGGLVSELPLLAEFCVRNGAKQEFFRVLAEASPLPGHVVLLRYLEQMIAFNFTVFTSAEYQQLSSCVSNFAQTADRQLREVERQREGWPAQWLQTWPVHPSPALREIKQAAEGIQEECRKARFLYLKSDLSEGLNLEINQDKEVVQSHLQASGFSSTLIECLSEADRLYQETATPFDLKSSMGHLRSFLETLHAEASSAVAAKGAVPPPEKWGACLTYLQERRVISTAEQKFVAGLYTLISDEAVHPLIAEREYARLTRNVVIEYALLLLRKLDKHGMKPGTRT